MSLKVTVLGSGTSHGVPMIGCDCAVCRSDDPRDTRTRPSILLEHSPDTPSASSWAAPIRSVLIDTSTDLRRQALSAGLRHVDAILYTHSHADHIFGLDEVRRFNMLQRESIPCYADARTLRDLRRAFSYIFSPSHQDGGGVPQVTPFLIGGPFCLGDLDVVPVPVLHGHRPILGFRFGAFAYLTDCSAIPDASWPLLDGVDVLILDALRHRPHPTHFSVSEALGVISRLRPRAASLTHSCHDLPHAATCAALPSGVELAYDGLILEI